MAKINLILDFALIFASAWMLIAIQRLGDSFRQSFFLIAWGSILIGIAHILETIVFAVFQWDTALVELGHRLIVLLGVMCLAIGFMHAAKVQRAKE